MLLKLFVHFFIASLYLLAKTSSADVDLESFSEADTNVSSAQYFTSQNTSLSSALSRKKRIIGTALFTFSLFGIKFIARPDTAFDHSTNTTINYKDMGFFQYMTFETDRVLTFFMSKLKFIAISFTIILILAIVIIVALILLPCSSQFMTMFFSNIFRNIFKVINSCFARTFSKSKKKKTTTPADV